MKHHYYSTVKGEVFNISNSRKEIVSDNPVLKILRNNGYKNHLILEHSYLLVNRPTLGFDYCNISYDELGYFSKGFEVNKNVIDDLSQVFKSKKPTFSFIQQISPGHISNNKNRSIGVKGEQRKYLEKLKDANVWLKEIVKKIKQNDKNALIIIAADHGGFVGMQNTQQILEIQENPLLVNSAFSAICAVKWPKGIVNLNDKNLKSSVNLFRVLFSNLSNKTAYLNNLEKDISFTQIKNGNKKRIYSCISQNNEVKYIPL